ncbi:MAG: hypothetical protein IJ195_06720 [Lachnospiraceae bacterium]|jgi:hypothetical protein|nr:hypothetical protein [Lachnospiraceae bacterium]MBQ8139127.1 hypothetical protein [Lachnospiraceae bacterium]MBR1650208.1 hypothetical protein [Lachnospiraceae bacterium]MBR4278455.1 hypothetical protein [Lachnospiraceae bacterium]MBR6303254.1 hypothetical protein [Lachnospiraceae bacterium]
MINFEEELKNFHPSVEVGKLEDTVYSLDLTDAADMLVGMMKETEEQQTTEAHYQ